MSGNFVAMVVRAAGVPAILLCGACGPQPASAPDLAPMTPKPGSVAAPKTPTTIPVTQATAPAAAAAKTTPVVMGADETKPSVGEADEAEPVVEDAGEGEPPSKGVGDLKTVKPAKLPCKAGDLLASGCACKRGQCGDLCCLDETCMHPGSEGGWSKCMRHR